MEKGSRSQEENKRLRRKLKGADSAQGREKMHEGKNQNVREKQRITGENKRLNS